ncbi:hypothetical protein [Marinimicrobium sp. LS-A18]|uniref:hypothetical protein n=1 Tax=Marinimicrobium sp. LS-A18 TaxID=1381596 RepID=UPI000464D5C0|nr:hypothetical protein [Marinimicrobium sp. LS-A18]
MNTQLKALELAREGDWHGAHDLVQAQDDPLSCLIHGYLHREEGDLGNAGYWYRRAGETLPDNTLDEEWQRLRQRAAD